MVVFEMGFTQNTKGTAEHVALGNASVLVENVYAVYNNPSSFSFEENIEIGLFSSGNNFVKGVGFFGMAFSKVFKKENNFAVGVSRFGYNVLNFNKISLAYSRKLSEKLRIGTGFDYEYFRIEAHGHNNMFAVRTGFTYELNNKVSLGGYIKVPTQKNSEYINYEVEILAGTKYRFHEKGFLLLEFNKSLKDKLVVATGLEYRPIKLLSFRIGFGSNPTLVSSGIGLEKGVFGLDMATSYHSELGFKSDVSLQFFISKKKDL